MTREIAETMDSVSRAMAEVTRECDELRQRLDAQARHATTAILDAVRLTEKEWSKIDNPLNKGLLLDDVAARAAKEK